jgi:hypothetical protein
MRTTTKGLLLAIAMTLAACGGGAGAGAGTTATNDPVATVQCDPDDPATHDACGTVVVGLTDADGDFVNYTVDVLSIELETADGRTVETLPRRTRINFTDYVDLTEIVSARMIPPATYVAGTIRLDYANAEIFVEADGDSKEAVVTDIEGNPLGQTELRVGLANRDQLRITKGRAALLQLDFDLDASHTVDIVPTPAEATSEMFIVAEVSPVDEKDIRVRGLLGTVNVDEMAYAVRIRPFHDRDGDHGRLRVHVTEETVFEINEELFTGAAGLRALEAAGAGTPTIAGGTLSVAEREFTAARVLAGSSVPGYDRDAVVGNVIARDGNLLTVRGATIIPSDRAAHFHDDVVVEVGPDTIVFRDGHRRRDLGIEAISIGQRVTIRGDAGDATTATDTPQILFDATQGAIRMHVTRVSGIVNSVMAGQADITLHAIDRRRAAIFDFTGTGSSPEVDADPANYEINTYGMLLAAFAEGKPIVAMGFPSAFGMAPPDFHGRTVIDFTDVRSKLGFGWGSEGTTAPFSGISVEGLVVDIDNEDLGGRHHVKQGPVLMDLTALDADTTIVPTDRDRKAFYIKTADSLHMYTDFADFVEHLNSSLDGAIAARSLHAVGQYDTDTNVFTAVKIGIYLLEPTP